MNLESSQTTRKMCRLLLSALFIAALVPKTNAQNLFVPANNAKLAKYPVISLHNSIYYLSVRLDSPAAALPAVSYFFSRVDAQSGALIKTVLLLRDTAFNPDENFQPLALSYCVNAAGDGINFFAITDADSSQKYWFYSNLWRYPKSISFFQLDTGLVFTIAPKKIIERKAFSRYTIWAGAGLCQSLSSGRFAFSFTVSDTLSNPNSPTSNADKLVIVDDTGKVIEDKFLGYEPTGTGTFFPNHFSETLYRLTEEVPFGSRVWFNDSLFAGRGPQLMLLDSNLNMYDTADCPGSRPFGQQVLGKKNISFLGLITTFFGLPTGSIGCYSSGAFDDSTTDSTYRYYALAKGPLHPGYQPTAMYFPPKASGDDYEHSAHEGFPGALYNAYDNRIYSFSATETYPVPPFYYCMNGRPNLGQLVCVDTNLQEQWVKYVHAQPGYCVQTFGVYQPQDKPGVIISGRIFKLNAPADDSQLECFIYYVDSTTQLGVGEPNSPLVITNPFVLYPNPATSELVLENVRGGRFQYALSDAAGRIIRQGQGSGTKTMLNVAPLATGIYYIQVFETTTKRRFSLRFVRP